MRTWGEIGERLDPLFYLNIMLLNRNIIEPSKHPITIFKLKVDMQRGRFGHRPRNDPHYYDGAYPFIQTGNIVKASESNEEIEYSQTLNELGLSTSRLFDKRVVVITIAANIGYTAILNYPACFPDSLVALSPKEKDISLEYLNIYVRFIQKYIENLAPQAAQKNINLKQLGQLPIIIPSEHIQKDIVFIMEKAYFAKRQKEKEAQQLLDSIDDYLLQELGITLPPKEVNTLENRMFFVNSENVFGGRLDPFYHKKIFMVNMSKLFHGKHSYIYLKNVAKGLIKGILPTDIEKNGECKVVQINNINADGTIDLTVNITSKPIYSSQHKLNKGDVLIVITGATIGKIGFWDYEGEYYLGGDIVKFNTGNYYLNIIYANLLKTLPYQLQLKRCVTGATNGHLALRDIENLPLPNITNLNTQKVIANRIISSKVDAQFLKEQTKKIIENAKLEVEKILIGGSL